MPCPVFGPAVTLVTGVAPSIICNKTIQGVPNTKMNGFDGCYDLHKWYGSFACFLHEGKEEKVALFEWDGAIKQLNEFYFE